jgi:hypothetical protein
MREKGIVARQKRRFRRTTDSNHADPIAPNVVQRDFEPSAPNEVWAGDVTYIATHEGWAYLAVLLDLCSRRVVGWAMSDTNDTSLALEALHRAVRSRAGVPAGLVHHTDRGSPYASDDYREGSQNETTDSDCSVVGYAAIGALTQSYMRRESVDEEGTRFVGLDVHKDTIAVAVAEPERRRGAVDRRDPQRGRRGSTPGSPARRS